MIRFDLSLFRLFRRTLPGGGLHALAILAAALLLAGPAHGGKAEQVFQVGITSFRDKMVTVREWGPTMAYLSSQVPGARFEAVPMLLPELEAGLKNREVDFVITNPEHYIILETHHGVSRVATLVKKEQGQVVNRFGGVVFTRSDRDDIRTLKDVKGRTIASVDRTSFAAFLLQYDLLKENGIDIDKDCRVLFLGFPQDLSVKAVLERRADVGFVRTGVLEAMAREGKIDLSRIRVLTPAAVPAFPFLLSTGLYPEWPLAAAPHVPMDVTNQVVAALLLMPPDSPAAASARYYRWSTPVEYLGVQNLMRRHRIYPYDKREDIALGEVFREYALPILAGLALVACAITILYIRSRRLNVELKISRQKLSELAHHDPLTGLPNRNLLDDDLEKAIVRAKRTGHTLAVCLMDLDGFKPVNDQWGHKVGDEVLQEIAQRLLGILRGYDTVARWGGDEFVLLLNGVAADDQLRDIMERVLAAVSRGFACCKEARVGASIGVSIYPSDSEEGAGLLKRADEAMYHAKRSGGNRYALYAALPGREPAAVAAG